MLSIVPPSAKHFASSLIHSHWIKDSGKLLSANIVAQGVAFLAYMVLSRLFTPADFALYNIFFSYIEVLIILSTGKYELAIVKAHTDTEAAHLFRITLWLNGIVSALLLFLALVMVLCGVSFIPLPSSLILLIPLMVFFCGTTRVYTFVFTRFRQFGKIAASEVVTSFSGVGLKILFGFLNGVLKVLHTMGLPLATVMGKVAGNIYYRLAYLRHPLPPAPRTDTWRQLKEMLHRYSNFPRYSAPKELVSSFSANLPFIWLGAYFNNVLIGLFSLALTFTMRPVNILANIFEKIFYPSTNQRYINNQPIRREIYRFLWALNTCVVPVLLVAFFFAEPIFTFLFGSRWIGTGYYVRCLLPWVLFLINANSLAFLPNVFNTQRVDFLFQLVQLLLRVVALAVGCYRQDFALSILLFCQVSAVVQALQVLWYLYQTHRYDHSLSLQDQLQS